MQVSRLSWVERGFVVWALALASVAVLTVLVALGVWISDNSSNVASWVQAVGSIAAIAAGFGVARFQLEEQRREQRARDAEAERQTKRKQCALLFERYTSVGAFSETTIELHEKGFFHWAKVKPELRLLLQLFQVLGVQDVPEPEDFWNVTFICNEMDLLLETLGGDGPCVFENVAHRERADMQLQAIAESARTTLDELAERLHALTTSAEKELVRSRLRLKGSRE